jgi:predicted Zn-dependent protease
LWNNRIVTHVVLVVVLTAAGAAAGVVPVSAGPASPQAAAVPVPAQARQSAGAADRLAEAYYQFMLGRRLESNDDVPGAITAFRRALELDPTSAVIRAELATLFARQGRIADALTEAKAGLAHDAENAELHQLMGMIAAEGAHSDDESLAGTATAQAAARTAIGHLERALAGATLNAAPGIRLALGRLSLQTKEYDKAITALRQLLVDEPGFPQGVGMLAEAYQAAGKPESAIDLLKDASQLDPDFHASLAKAYETAERWEEAAAAYERASAANPRDTDVKVHWALSLLNAEGDGQAARARDLLLDVTRTSPGHAWALYLLARAQRETGDLEGAERSARRLLVLSPASVSGAHVLAQVLAERRAFGEVIDVLSPVIDKLPPGRDADRALLLTHVGFAYLGANRLQDSVAAFERGSSTRHWRSCGLAARPFPAMPAWFASKPTPCGAWARWMPGRPCCGPWSRGGPRPPPRTRRSPTTTRPPAVMRTQPAPSRGLWRRFQTTWTSCSSTGRCSNARSGARTRSVSSVTCWPRIPGTRRRSTTSATCWRSAASGSPKRWHW